jgi:hypothetical protein
VAKIKIVYIKLNYVKNGKNVKKSKKVARAGRRRAGGSSK